MRLRDGGAAILLVAFCFLFGLAAADKIVSIGHLETAMGKHNVLPLDVVPFFARLVAWLEVSLTVLCGLSVFLARLRPWAALAVAALTASFSVYLGIVAFGPEPYVPCGCAVGRELPVNLAFWRALGLLALSLVALVLALPRAGGTARSTT